MNPYESIFHDTLTKYLRQVDAIDERHPECPDLEELWGKIGEAYLPDGTREFNAYPTVALGWIMYVGMALAAFWDRDWETYSKEDNLYTYLLGKTDFDHLDDYIRQQILHQGQAAQDQLEKVVRAASEQVNDRLRHLDIEPGTANAFKAFVAALHQMYLMGIAMQLKRMGYHMEKY